ncbi:MAG TPA: flagellar hook-basal body complex protein FliE [Methylovirgula sp.]
MAGNFVASLPNAAQPATATDFGSVLSQVASDTMSKLNTGEATAISGIEGKASVQQVVSSVMDAQTSLQTALAIRDKIVSAYQEVSRMAI